MKCASESCETFNEDKMKEFFPQASLTFLSIYLRRLPPFKGLFGGNSWTTTRDAHSNDLHSVTESMHGKTGSSEGISKPSRKRVTSMFPV